MFLRPILIYYIEKIINVTPVLYCKSVLIVVNIISVDAPRKLSTIH